MHRIRSLCLDICPCLQALWYYCQPPLASLQLLAAISSEAAMGKLRGSALLNLLHQRSHAVAGDDQARRLLQKLLHAACTPYFRCYSTLRSRSLNPVFLPDTPLQSSITSFFPLDLPFQSSASPSGVAMVAY